MACGRMNKNENFTKGVCGYQIWTVYVVRGKFNWPLNAICGWYLSYYNLQYYKCFIIHKNVVALNRKLKMPLDWANREDTGRYWLPLWWSHSVWFMWSLSPAGMRDPVCSWSTTCSCNQTLGSALKLVVLPDSSITQQSVKQVHNLSFRLTGFLLLFFFTVSNYQNTNQENCRTLIIISSFSIFFSLKSLCTKSHNKELYKVETWKIPSLLNSVPLS